jgi:hypothetical protein
MIGKVWPALLLGVIVSAGPARADNSFQAFRKALIDYFEPQGYLPVIADRGYGIGDVVNIDGVNLYARANRCFPHIKPPVPVSTSIPDVAYAYDIGMSFGLRLRQLFDSGAGADLVRRVEIQFTDVTALSIALLDLRDALDRSACPDIAPLIDGTLQPLQPGQTAFFVVSEMLMGKREARLQFATNSDLEVKTRQIMRQVGDASLKVRASNDGGVTLRSEIVGPIAMKPVTIPKVVKLYSFNDVRGYEEEPKVKWVPVECRVSQGCSQQFSPFADLVRSAAPPLSTEEVDR